MKRFVTLLPILVLAASAHAGVVISNFADLREELVLRDGILSNSVDKVELKQDKACLKGIVLIDKGANLADDIKASAKLASLLQKAFPDEFAAVLTAVFSNNVRTIIFADYNNIGETLSSLIDTVQLSVTAMPVGNDRDHAQAALGAASAALDSASNAFFGNGDLKATTKFFASCLKSIAKAEKIIAQSGPM